MSEPAEFRVYGDFICPFCHTLNEHLHLMDLGERVTWMPIQHLPDLKGDLVDFETLCELTEEVTEVRRRAPTAEISIPAFRPSSALAAEHLTLARRLDPRKAVKLRRLIYRAYWVHGRNISNLQVLRELETEAGIGELEGDREAQALLRRWQREWEDGPYDRRTPVSVAPNGASLVGLQMPEVEAFFHSSSPLSTAESSAVCEMKPRQCVVVVDRDAASVRQVIASMPEYHIEVLDGVESLSRRLGEAKPMDLLLLDLGAAGPDWPALVAQMTPRPGAPSVALILAGEDRDRELESAAFEAGAADFLSKPYQPATLKARLRTHLQMRRSQELLRELARTDSLTELYNRREFDLQLQFEWERAVRYGAAISVLMMDIDHFKQYNDHYGHSYGDECLRRVAQSLRKCLRRPTDLLARYGGEEFACVLPSTGASGVSILAERCRAAIEAERIPHAGSSAAAHVTISVGAASCAPTRGALAQELLATADRRLYEAKRSGRNRVVFARSPL
jgi:diguanylate cyclase (GGDEF)-like protein